MSSGSHYFSCCPLNVPALSNVGRKSSVSIKTKLWTGHSRFDPQPGKDVKNIQAGSGAYPGGTRHKTNLPHPVSAEGKNEWRCTYTLPRIPSQ